MPNAGSCACGRTTVQEAEIGCEECAPSWLMQPTSLLQEPQVRLGSLLWRAKPCGGARLNKIPSKSVGFFVYLGS